MLVSEQALVPKKWFLQHLYFTSMLGQEPAKSEAMLWRSMKQQVCPRCDGMAAKKAEDYRDQERTTLETEMSDSRQIHILMCWVLLRDAPAAMRIA